MTEQQAILSQKLYYLQSYAISPTTLLLSLWFMWTYNVNCSIQLTVLQPVILGVSCAICLWALSGPLFVDHFHCYP